MNRLELTIAIKAINKPPRKVNVRADLPVADFVTAIKDHFNLDGQYELRQTGTRQPLDGQKTLVEAGVRHGAALDCLVVQERSNTPELIQSGDKRRFSQTFGRVYFRDQNSLTEYELRWWPAIIGRRDIADPSRNKLLAVDLEAGGVSRHHACVTEASGAFFIEALAENNPVFVEGKKLKVGLKYPLPTGTTIQLGQVLLNFNVRS
jgi:hypothetical protein